MNQTNKSNKEKREEQAQKIIERACQDASRLKYGRVTIFIDEGYAYRVETTDSYIGGSAS